MSFYNLLKGAYSYFYGKVTPNPQTELQRAIGDCKTLLDVGCGDNSPIKSFSNKLYCVGVDIFELSIKKSQQQRIHDRYYKLGVLDIEKKFKADSFDCVIALEIIEHLTKKDGFKLIDMMEKIANKKIIISVPNGFLPQKEYGNNPWQVHRSGWTVREMQRRRYKMLGIGGWKPLRTERALIRFWPKHFWTIISDVSQIFVRNNPEKAFQILCIKTKKSYPSKNFQ